ncbi:MAG: L-2-hydroxyglutarate oxidase [Armatimonadota bacterium]|nr:L-2-hydroxyglutarate oxidase [Armatimonadota bacterium]MDW8156304.1 L-2-hydroxyglutarate oxidase [Armatimonadota bacterium]
MASELPARCDVAVVGGGIVGLACAHALARRFPDLRLVVLEKEAQVGSHQTSHNSGVVHAGIYYRPGSLRARLCVEGARRLREFCEEHGLPFQAVGKVIVATCPEELPALEELLRRGEANGVPGLRWLRAEELREVEPHATGLAAIHSPATAITDFRQVAVRLAELLEARGAAVVTGCALRGARRRTEGFELDTARGPLLARAVLNCAGLHSDRVARMLGARPGVRILPFRGEYYVLRPDRRHLVRGLIYPVPDPRLPFLGVHLTRTVHGEVEAGPNAVLAWAREGYRRWTFRLRDAWDSVGYSGFWWLARRYWKVALYEQYRSWSRREFTRSVRRLVPEVQDRDLVRDGAGVRAQAVAPDGTLVDDFRVVLQPGAVHVLNAPSPAATASLAIGDYVAQLAAEALGLQAQAEARRSALGW